MAKPALGPLDVILVLSSIQEREKKTQRGPRPRVGYTKRNETPSPFAPSPRCVFGSAPGIDRHTLRVAHVFTYRLIPTAAVS